MDPIEFLKGLIIAGLEMSAKAPDAEIGIALKDYDGDAHKDVGIFFRLGEAEFKIQSPIGAKSIAKIVENI